MNYPKIYNSLIKRAQERVLTEGYLEKHHIIPKCLGGGDELENLVSLTPEEHFVCHQLLVKIHPNNPKLAYAANMMTISPTEDRVQNNLFGWLRRKLSTTQKGIVFSKERCENISKALVGRTVGPMKEETKKKLSIANTGKVRTEQMKAHLSKINTGKKHTDESRAKMSASRVGVPKSEAHKRAVSLSKIGTKKIEVSPGVFKMFNPAQLEEFRKSKESLKYEHV